MAEFRASCCYAAVKKRSAFVDRLNVSFLSLRTEIAHLRRGLQTDPELPCAMLIASRCPSS
jgi:hypothetical protein